MQAQSNNEKSEHVDSQKPRPEAVLADKRPVQSRLGRQEGRPEAVLGAKRPVRRPSWPSGGRLRRQQARPEAVLNAKRPVQRLSWTPGGSSAGRLGRQEARMQVLLQFLQKNAGFAQAAVRLPSSQAAKPHCRIFV